MFWRFNNMCTTNIDILLNEEDITLQRLMEEDDIIQECKSNNRKLIDFLVKPEVLHELVKLVTKEPSSDSPDATRFKFNNIAAELFACDVTSVNDAIVSDESYLTELCEILYEEPPLHPLMASFFSKAMAVLIGKKSEKMLEYLKIKEGFMSQLIQHLRTSAIMDLIVKLVTCVENKNSRLEIAQWLCSEHIVERMMGLLSTSKDSDVHVNVATLLCDLLRLLRDMHAQNLANDVNMDNGSSEPTEVDPILCCLESKCTVDLLLEHMLGADATESSIVNGVTILLILLEVRRPPPSDCRSAEEHSDSTPPVPVTTPCIRNTVEAIIPRLKDLHQVLLEPPQKTESNGRSQGCAKPFGFVRLQVTRLIAAVVATGSSEAQKELATLGTFSLLLDMLMEYSHNNFLHAQVERSVQYILGLEPIDLLQPVRESEQPTSPTHPLLSHLMTETCVIQRIMDAWEFNDQNQNQSGGLRQAYMGHLIRMGNYVADFRRQGKNSTKIHELFLNFPEELCLKWEDFVENKLTAANRNNEITLVTSKMAVPRISSDEDEPEVSRHALHKDTALQEVFSDYQMEVMSKHVVTQFGFADTQFNDNDDQLRSPPKALVNIALPEDAEELSQQSDLFEQVCNERMQFHQKGGTADGNDDEDDDEVWLQRGKNSSVISVTTVRPESSSSDEDETIGDDTNESMDIDSIDPWEASIGNVAPAAVDAGNPWEAASSATESSQDAADDNWANFSKADDNSGNTVEDNWANFTSADFCAFSNSTPMEVNDSLNNPASAESEVSLTETGDSTAG